MKAADIFESIHRGDKFVVKKLYFFFFFFVEGVEFHFWIQSFKSGEEQ